MTKHSISTSTVFRLAVLALAMVGAGSASAGDSAIASSTGTVVAPIDINKTADLVFGSFAPGATGGTVTVSTAGVRSKGGDVILIGTAGAAAAFDVSGAGGLNYSIDLTTSPLSNGSGGTMNFTATSSIASGTLSAGATGTQSFTVGGELTVATAQAAGDYTGSVTATVEYE